MAEDWLTIVLRLALYLDMAAAFGVALFGVYALGHDERSLAISRRYRIYVGVFAVMGLGLSIIGMTRLAKALAGAQNYSELSAPLVQMLVLDTPMGLAWCVRILALLLCVLMTVLTLTPARRFAAMTASSGVALSTLAWAGHGAMDDGIRGFIHLASDIAHLWAAGAWVGALLAFLILAMMKAGAAQDTVQILSRTSNGFARIGTLIVLVLTVSGILNYLLIAGPVLEPLVSTLYGRLLLGKLALFGGMLVLAAANRFSLSPALEASLKTGNHGQAVAKLRQSLFTEATLAVLVLASVAWLGMLSPKGA
ncbi:copper homeostasis membrane protein CopD [Comamonas sp. lk]|uniref:copper homeostasis membrane protein CopD n=1 Tax=Comamonas sp. lk TaxID=2201272 RepID=UPI000EB5B0B5|nr:copper homeostasis membrane protein CopD [Comamonas sp. lk]